jgi:hypothetical protein
VENKTILKSGHLLVVLSIINIRNQIGNQRAVDTVGLKPNWDLLTNCAPGDRNASLSDYTTMGKPTQDQYFFFPGVSLCLWHNFYTLYPFT